MDSAAKQRNPRNREWERQRRNKFNDAIAKLGDLVKAINKANNASSEEDNAQYPKIEIIQKAIVCLTSYAQEKTQLKAEILALQVKLDGEKSNTANKKDASTQVYIAINRKKKNGKVVKIVMLDKSSNKNNKNKSISISETKTANVPQKLPMLLPRTTINNKKGTENAIVVLPAAPYIFPQRPFLVPAAPPAIVLVDPNLQALSKPSVPIVNRNNGDITKTTMVNILPISAYSGPLSAIKNKKHSVRLKSDSNKKINKKIKTTEKSKAVSVNATNKPDGSNKPKESNTVDNESISKDLQLQESKTDEKESTPKKITTKVTPGISNPELDNHQNADSMSNNKDIISIEKSSVEVPKTIEESKPPNIDIGNSSSTTTVITSPAVDTKMKTEDNKTNKLPSSKEPLTEIINEKDNKIPNILDQPLCDSAVDGGNARLELAEEFLAASPTAAFLMSFPLVSGNRADSPAEEPTTAQSNSKDTISRRNDVTNQQGSYFEKHVPHYSKGKANNQTNAAMVDHKSNEQLKCVTSLANKRSPPKTSTTTHNSNASSENPFLNLPMPSLIPASCTISDSTLGLDFDCNINKPMPSQATSFANSSNLFYKNDPFSTVKSTIYSTSSISGNHDFNSLGLYPCAMEKYTPKNKSEYANMEDSFMKMGSSRLTYDIDLGWSHKSFDFVNCTTASNTLTKDSILPTSSISYSSSYNPFNPEFHVPLVSNPSKKDNISSKPTSTFTETITSFYSQATNLWPEDVPFYSSSNINTSSSKHKNYLSFDHSTINTQPRANASKSYDMKDTSGTQSTPAAKSTNMSGHGISDKYTKKSSNKMHINWMTSEIRPLQPSCNLTLPEIKEIHKSSFNNVNHKVSYNNSDNMNKKQELNEGNYFPISMHNYPTQVTQEEFQAWPSARPLGTAEVSIEPPPINLPTLVGDLALGPHDKKKSVDPINRPIAHNDAQNCGNFLSVTQIMNRSTDNTRYAATNVDVSKSIPTKQNVSNFTSDHARKGFTSSRMENNPTEPYYVLNDSKIVHSYDNIPQYPQAKPKLNNKTEKNVKSQKNNYSAEALIRTGNCTQKVQDSNSSKFMMASQKYNDFTPQDSSVAQVSHYPPILDYSENVYVTQQFSGTTLYNSTTNTISNSFYSNFMPGTSNLITSNYTAGPFTGDFIDYNQSTECNYTNHKYEDLKMRNNPMVCVPEKGSNYKTPRREATKHKLECKKESSKKVQNKRTKLSTEVEEWCDPNLLLWQNKSASKRHPNLMSEELPFPNYVGNQMPTQYQPDFFNSHLMTSNVQNMGHSVDRSLATLPVTSRANFNLSTIFPEITMKVQ